MKASQDWSWPAYKILANNDTGSAPGHQGGIVVPEALRHLFPQLSGSLSVSVPTLDKQLRAELYECNERLATVETRYQYQSWGGARSPESRLTGQLGPLRKRAKGGDLLLIQYNQLDSNLLRLTLVPKTSEEYAAIAVLIGEKRWGAVPTVPLTKGLAERDEWQAESSEEDKPLAEIDTTSLTTWAVIAFVARCARRFLECYESDASEPNAQRVAVAQAVSLAEKIAANGGVPNEVYYIEMDGQHFDHHDFVAMEHALSASQQAAENTYAELQEDKGIERYLARMLTAICLSELAFSAAVADDPSYNSMEFSNLAQEALAWATWAEPSVEPAILKDFRLLVDYTAQQNLTELSPVPPEIFGELWPDGRPAEWPAMKLSFRPRARIIRTIGDRLVSGPEAAVIELVKNSYDADSSFVRITFVPGAHNSMSEIIFEDDGHGMTLQDIEQKWMEPATSDKRDRRVSSKGRRLLGSKGIGRFAASRLGQYLEMVSTAKKITQQSGAGDKGAERLTTTRIPLLDWNAFEQAKYLDDVSFEVEALNAAKTTGTTLRISLLRDEWSTKRIQQLHEELRKLVSPIPHVGAASFKIFLDLSLCTVENCSFDGPSLFAADGTGSAEMPRVLGEPFEVRPFPLLDACDYSIDGVFDEVGHFEGTLTIQRGGLEPESIQLDVPLQVDQGEEECGVVLVRLHVFDRETDAIRSTAAKAGFGTIGIREARKLLDNIAGVAIYREGFRIRPYGDGENDWLTLDAKRVQNPTIKIGRNQIAGVVSLDDERDSHLIERSSREGLEENGSFKRLRSLISTLLAEVVEPKRRQFRISAGLDVRPETSFRDVYDKVRMGWSKILLAKIPESERADAEELVSKESEKLTQYLKRLEERQAQLEARVTLGLIIGEVMHQGNTPLSFIETEAARLTKWWPRLLSEGEGASVKRIEVPRILNGLVASGGKLRVLFDALNPLAGARRGSPKPYDPSEVIEQTLYLFKSKIEDLGIEVAVDILFESSAIFGYKDDLATAVTNLVDNAIYWLAYHKVAFPKIAVTVIRSGDRCMITITDNGTGVPAEFSDQLFDIGFTLKPNGTGLGLSIAKEAIYRSNGDMYLQDSEIGTRFKISLPAIDK